MKPKRSAQAYFTVIQVLYWVAIGMTFSFASLYMQSRGVPNGQIGFVLAAAYVLSALLQPVIAAIMDHWEIPLARGVIAIYGIATAFALALYFLPLSGFLLMALLSVTFSLVSALQPSVNSLARVLENLEMPVNFGAARGTGSLVYAICMAITGRLLQQVSPMFLPISYAVLMTVSILLLLVHRPIMSGRLQIRAADAGGFPPVREYPLFWVFLLSVVCLSMGEGFHSAFLLQIMQNVGGDSATTGLAMGVCASVEFFAMLGYSRASRKFGVNRLMIVCAWAWILKAFLMFAAKSPAAIYGAYLLQFITYAVYIPGSIEFVSKLLPERSFLKGQSLTVSFYTVGCVLASFFGGMMLDRIGVKPSLAILVGIMSAGAVLMTVAAFPRKQK